MKQYLLGIDIGTSACKVALFDEMGNVINSSTKSYKVYYPKNGFAEQDPNEWWDQIVLAIKEIVMNSNISNEDIKGIGIDGQSWSCIPIDKKGKVLYNTPIWMDTRASYICDEVKERIGEERIFEISGNSFEPTYTTPKILWFKKELPEIYKATEYFLQSNSYIGYKLTGNVSQDMSQAYGLHFFNMEKGEYDKEFCEELGIDFNKVPKVSACHEVIGEVTEEASMITGLAVGTKVVAGGLDACCGTLGAKVLNHLETQEQGGQAGGMSICLEKYKAHPKLIMSYHVVPDKWLLQGGTVGGGASMEWFKREFAAYEEQVAKEKDISVFQVLDEEASDINIGSDGLIYLPYMAGERSPLWDQHAKGVYFGLDFSKTRAHMIRATLEGVAFSLMHNLETAKEVDVEVDNLHAMGGAANSRLWMQIKSDITNKPIHVPASDTATTLGAAILAGVGVGVYKSFEEAVEKTVEIKKSYYPNQKSHDKYMKYYEIYKELYIKLKETMKKINDVEGR